MADLRQAFHDLRNSLGALLLDLEVAADPAAPADVARSAAADALRTAQVLEREIEALRARNASAGVEDARPGACQ